MKRYWVFITLAALAILPSCMKGESLNDSDYVGGWEGFSNRRVRTYMMGIADDLMAGVLDELELALNLDARNVAHSSHFTIGGELTTPGSTWTVKAEDSQFKDMAIRCTGADAWQLSFEGDFALAYEDNIYPTVFSMSVRRHVPDSQEVADTGWVVVLSGSREERCSYRCTFETSSLSYINTRGTGAVGWNQMFGDLYMNVFKGSEEVDMCCLSFEGSPSQATLLRGL